MTIVNDSCVVMASQQQIEASDNIAIQLIEKLKKERREGTMDKPHELSSLERQNSCDSVGSMCEEGIQADADTESLEGSSDSASDTNVEVNTRSGRSSSVVSDASEEGGRDSGIEAEREPDMVIPDDESMERIVTQVEFYFSDSNVAKDKFLLKHIRRNKEGYVSLKLVSSFKKIKQLTKDWRVVAFALTKKSVKIQLNDQGSKIRRTDPLPEIDDSPITSDVIAINLPLDKPSIATVSEIFGECGEIQFIRINRAGGNLPSDIKHMMSKHPVLKDTQSAWIQFDSSDAAKKAIEMSDDSMMIVPVIPDMQKKQEKTPQEKPTPANSRKNSQVNPSKGQTSRKNSYNNKIRKESSSGMENHQRRPQRRHAVSMPSTYSPNLEELQGYVESRNNRRPKSKSCTENPIVSGGSPSNTSWVQRHLFAAAAASAASAASSVVGAKPPNGRGGRISQGSLPLPETVIRLPKGPDGSRGFNTDSRRRSVNVAPATITVSS